MDPFEEKMKRRKRLQVRIGLILPVLIALLIGASVYVFTYHINAFQLDLKLHGDERIILEYGESYHEEGAEAVFSGSHILPEGKAVPVTVSGTVDESKVGQYTLTYEASHERWHVSKSRTVEIRDSVPPRIWLIEKPGHYLIPGEQYREEGFMARDNYDGDLTDKVQKILLKDKVIYLLEDSSGNKARVVRDIVYYDPIPPVIILEGQTTVTIQEGKTFREPGYTAMDNCDGDLTERVRVSGSVDTSKPGTYRIIYSVEDSFGNRDEEMRTVVVRAKPKPRPQQSEVTPSGKVIYLTFDDGPSKHTQRLLEILDKYNVKATFFVVNSSYSHLIDDIVNDGHAIAAHAYNHSYRDIYASEEAYFDDLDRILSLIKRKSGKETKLIRFPGGSSNTASRFNEGIMSRLTNEVVDRGYRYFDWNVDSDDAGSAKTANKVYENVIQGVQNRRVSIVLQHDTKGYSVEAVEKIIIWGLENGYKFLPLKEDSPTAAHDLNN